MPKSKGRRSKAADKKARVNRIKVLRARREKIKLQHKKMIEDQQTQIRAQIEEEHLNKENNSDEEE